MEYYSSLDASQLDSETPTLFELISANQLEALLSPSLRYILVHYAQRYPQYLLKITNKFDELNLFLRSFVEWYFLKYWQGSFTENFYGLKRVSQTPLSDPKYNLSKLTQLVPSMVEERRQLSRTQMLISIFEITGVSYLLEKCTYQYELLYSKYITNQLDEKVIADKNERRRVWMQRKYVELFPYVQSAWRLLNLATTLMYLSGSTKSPSLLTILFKINYLRLNQYDYSKNEPPLRSISDKRPDRVAPPSTVENLIRYLTKYITKPSWKTIRFILGTSFPLAIFALKFLEWWNNSDFAKKVAKSLADTLSEMIPPPSTIDYLGKNEKHQKRVYKSGLTCPLCKQEILNPAIIETGYVFCYTCIYNFLRDSHKLVKPKGEDSDIEVTDDEAENDEEENEDDEKDEDDDEKKFEKPDDGSYFDVSKGGRCPITGRKLLGCKWNAITQEFDVDGIRRLIF